MKRSRFTETQIVKILKEADAGVAVEQLSRQHGFSRSAFYKWKAKYSGMDVTALKRLKELEAENQKLKEMYADLSLAHKVIKVCKENLDQPVLCSSSQMTLAGDFRKTTCNQTWFLTASLRFKVFILPVI